MPFTIIIKDERDRFFARGAVDRARIGQQVRVSKPDRNPEQNSKYHAMLTDISKQLLWPQPPREGGELHDVEWWKRRTTLGWLIDEDKMPEVIESLEGREFAILLPHTSHLNTEEYAALIEWTTMFGATNGVVFKEPDDRPTPPPEAYEDR
jgi:hypothetical protein